MLPPLYCRAFLCPAFLFTLAAVCLHAEEPAAPRTMTADECLSRVRERSPELKSGAFRIEAAMSRAQQAARRLNPRLETEIENVGGSGEAADVRSAESTVALSQEFELGNKRLHRVAAAEAEAAISRAEATALLNDLLFDTRQALLAVLAAQEHVRLAEETLTLSRETEAVILAREQAGKATALETERARTETARDALAVQERQAEQQDAVRALALCWGDTEPTFDAVKGTLDVPAAGLPPLDALLLQAATRPGLRVADAHVQTLEARARIENAARLPNVEVSAGLRHFEASDDYGFVAGVGVELPLVNRNRDAARAAEADAEAARLDAAAARVKTDGLLRRLYARLTALAAKDAQLRTAVIPSSERTLAFVRQAHEQGKVGYLDVLEARRSLTEARCAVIAASVEYHTCRIELERLASGTDEK